MRLINRDSGDMEKSDEVVLSEYRKGDVSSLEGLVEKYKRPLFGFILNMVRNKGDAEEIFQEVWFKAIKKIDSYRNENFFGWLVRIAHNTVIDGSRKKKPDFSLDEERENNWSAKDMVSDSGPGPDRNAENAELDRKIKEAISSLPFEQKEVFVARVQSGLSFKEIARIQKVSINTALARMQYALEKLRPLLKEDYAALGKF